MRILNGDDVRRLLALEPCIDLMRAAMIAEATGGTNQPLRAMIPTPDTSGLLGWMPGYAADPAWLGLKAVTVFEGNFGSGIASHQGAILLFDAKTGQMEAVIDAAAVTAIRTAAASAVATDMLARTGATSLAVLGYGEQAAQHLAAIRLVRDLDRLLVWGRDPERARRFAQVQTALLGVDVLAVTLHHALTADIICATTAARSPYIEGRILRPGQHLNLVGSSVPSAAEIDGHGLAAARFYADCKANVLLHGGEFLAARAAGHVNDDDVLGSIGEVIIGRIDGRLADADLTIFKSLGMIVEDIFAADFILRQARESDAGIEYDW